MILKDSYTLVMIIIIGCDPSHNSALNLSSKDMLGNVWGPHTQEEYLALQVLIIVHTIIHHHSKVFTTGQGKVNPEHYVIKCMCGR